MSEEKRVKLAFGGGLESLVSKTVELMDAAINYLKVKAHSEEVDSQIWTLKLQERQHPTIASLTRDVAIKELQLKKRQLTYALRQMDRDLPPEQSKGGWKKGTHPAKELRSPIKGSENLKKSDEVVV
jgi:hypothetical protein